tara:strand:+ start:4350 stop:4991 length:642 start_codon:yes stop_codon:yes gene_type:complete
MAVTLLIPILLLVSILLKFTAEGEVIYSQKRVGVDGISFSLLKFATMLKNSENIGTGSITIKNDPRVLPLGKFLRKTKLNELPQLFNVIKGDMGIIGPRPLTRVNFNYYDNETRSIISKIKPGLSGIGSIYFRNEEDYLTTSEDPEEIYKNIIAPYKGKLEIWYSENVNLKNYLLAIFATIIAIIFNNQNIIFKIFPNLPIPNDDLTFTEKDE